MKFTVVLAALVAFSSCGQIQKIMDGTENLPSQIQETNNGMAKTNEAIRQQKMGVAMELMQNPKNREVQFPIPNDMMAGGKIMGEAIQAEEVLHFVKNYIVKINEVQFEGQKMIDAPDAPPGSDQIPNPEYAKFLHDKQADLSMVILVSGNLFESVVKQLVEEQSEQGAYRDILFQLLKMRVNFYNDMMLHAAMLDGDKKLDTLGKIEKAIEYNEKVEYVCQLPFADRIALQIKGFEAEANANLSKPLDRDTALNNWKKIKEKAESDFTAESFLSDPEKNEAALEEYNKKHKELLEKIQQKIDKSN